MKQTTRLLFLFFITLVILTALSSCSCTHVWKEATCTEPKTCVKCGMTEGEATGHVFATDITKEATCMAEGIKKYTCTVCGYTYEEVYTLSKLTSEQIYDMSSSTVGEIHTFDKKGKPLCLGSAFLISSDGNLLTNFHVIDEAYSAWVKINGTEYTVTSVVGYDTDIDLAVIDIDAKDLPCLNMCTLDARGGATVYAVGSSEGYTLSFSGGIVASPDRVFDKVHYIQHEAAVSSGNSGGPLFNEYGEVIGINTSSDISGQNLNLAIKTAEYYNLDLSSPLTMEEFYAEEGPYFEVFVGDYVIREQESNDSQSTAQKLTVNGTTVEGTINRQYDIDYYKFTLTPGETVSILMIPEYACDASGILLGLMDTGGNVIAAGSVEKIGSSAMRMCTYENNTNSILTLYAVLFYSSDYQYKNTVSEYALFVYCKES